MAMEAAIIAHGAGCNFLAFLAYLKPEEDVKMFFSAGLGGLVLYFLPSIIGRNKRNAGAIFLLNFFLGWTVVGWIVAMVWACSENPPVHYVPVAPGGLFCTACGHPAAGPARFCASCGRVLY